jgi:hypothetical protein
MGAADQCPRHVRVHHVDKDKDDPLLREVLSQRPEGPSRGRRRRGRTEQNVSVDLNSNSNNKASDITLEKPPSDSFGQAGAHSLTEHERPRSSTIAVGFTESHTSASESAAQAFFSPPKLGEDAITPPDFGGGESTTNSYPQPIIKTGFSIETPKFEVAVGEVSGQVVSKRLRDLLLSSSLSELPNNR